MIPSPAPAALISTERGDAVLRMTWWNGLTRREQAWWLQQAGSDVPADAWEAFKAREVRCD